MSYGRVDLQWQQVQIELPRELVTIVGQFVGTDRDLEKQKFRPIAHIMVAMGTDQVLGLVLVVCKHISTRLTTCATFDSAGTLIESAQFDDWEIYQYVQVGSFHGNMMLFDHFKVQSLHGDSLMEHALQHHKLPDYKDYLFVLGSHPASLGGLMTISQIHGMPVDYALTTQTDPPVDITILIPGMGHRSQIMKAMYDTIHDEIYIVWVRAYSEGKKIVISICDRRANQLRPETCTGVGRTEYVDCDLDIVDRNMCILHQSGSDVKIRIFDLSTANRAIWLNAPNIIVPPSSRKIDDPYDNIHVLSSRLVAVRNGVNVLWIPLPVLNAAKTRSDAFPKSSSSRIDRIRDYHNKNS